MISVPDDPTAGAPARLARYIEQHSIAASLLQFDQETPTVALAALVVGCQPEQIVKSVLFVLKDSPHVDPVLVITSGTAQIDFRRLGGLLGVGRKRIRLAPPEVVLARTGYPAGGVPPFGFDPPIRTFIDRSVFDQVVVYGGGGDDRTMLRVAPDEILRVTSGQVVDVRQIDGRVVQ